LLPIPRGNFSAIHISSVADPRPYADAEFAFKGAADHMRWWFRKPAFGSGLVTLEAIQRQFPDLHVRSDGEAITDLRTPYDANRILRYLVGLR
jgi:hypothetical protein